MCRGPTVRKSLAIRIPNLWHTGERYMMSWVAWPARAREHASAKTSRISRALLARFGFMLVCFSHASRGGGQAASRAGMSRRAARTTHARSVDRGRGASLGLDRSRVRGSRQASLVWFPSFPATSARKKSTTQHGTERAVCGLELGWDDE